MSYERSGSGTLDYMPYRLAESRLEFRGPRPKLTGAFTVFLGGTETYGRFISEPFPTLVSKKSGLESVNFGVMNAGVDVFLGTPAVLQVAQRSRTTVIQISGALNMSNRYYKVHPRRNDRFVGASNVMKMVFREIDFTEFHFTRHMLGALAARAPERYALLRDELQHAWVARMKLMMNTIGGRIVLLWVADHAPELETVRFGLGRDPLFVERKMIEQLRPFVAEVVEVVAQQDALDKGAEGMVYGDLEKVAANRMFGPAVHGQVSRALVPLLVQ